jgi:hypothetical protein
MDMKLREYTEQIIRSMDKTSDGKRGSPSCVEEVERDMLVRKISSELVPRVCSWV